MTPTFVNQEHLDKPPTLVHSFFVDGVEFRIFDRLYAVSSDARVLRQMQPCAPSLRPDGYLSVGRHRLLHRMVAICWCDRPGGAKVVHHKDGDKRNNAASNLEWITQKQHMGERHLGVSRNHKMSDAGKQKLRELRLGSMTSDATKAKQREAALRLGCKPPPRPVGTKCSAESVELMRRNSSKNTPCEVRGVIYPSFAEAARALGERLHTLRKRCLSKNFPDYRMLG